MRYTLLDAVSMGIGAVQEVLIQVLKNQVAIMRALRPAPGVARVPPPPSEFDDLVRDTEKMIEEVERLGHD